MNPSPPPKPFFEADLVPTTTTTLSPTLSSPIALARFEFESGKGNEGTKVLMVEIDEGNLPLKNTKGSGDWEIEWSSKTTVLSAKEGTSNSSSSSSQRVYFLLAPGASVPPVVKLSQGGRTIQTNPLPAIFPPELGVTATTAGRKGVLHTIWGKQRLSVLQKEIDAEMRTNGEGIGLEMALQEKQWIEDNFGLSPRVAVPPESQFLNSPTSPKSPGGGRLSEKLKGLKLGTSALELSPSLVADQKSTRSAHPLSPNLGDVAVSSFAAFHGNSTRPLRIVAQSPPAHLKSLQAADSRQGSRINSLDAITGGSNGNTTIIAPPTRKDVDVETETEDGDEEGDLFAVRLSPRSPEMTKSPFSFSDRDLGWKGNEE